MLELGRVGTLHVNKRRIAFNNAVVDQILHLCSKVNNVYTTVSQLLTPRR